MDITGLWTLQCMMFLMVAAGAILKKIGILKAEGKGMLTDLVLYFFLPCNIIHSFQMQFDVSILQKFVVVLAISLVVQAVCYGMSKVFYRNRPDGVRRVMRYCTLVSNSGFLGLPIAEGVFGAEGMMYASVFIIPMRVMMWSAGIACFTESPDFKTVMKKIAVHPCIIAVYIGLGLLLFQQPLGAVYTWMVTSLGPVGMIVKILLQALQKGINSAGACTTPSTMILIGMMLAEVKPRDMLNRDAMVITVVRLVLVPFLVLVGCRVFGISGIVAGVCILISGMPAGSTAPILASKYNCDYVFGTKCVVVSTLLSMLSIPLWCMAM